MKKLLIILFLTFSFVAYGQEMSVRSFYLAETDLTANTPGTMMEDQNGNVCALIKVETTLDGFSFDVGSLGIRDVKRVGGEMWVYVPFGIRKITISHPQLGVIRNYALPCEIEKGRTYILKLNATLGNRVYDSERKQKMILQVFPSNAKVEINGMSMSLDRNGICEQEFSFGVYDVMVSASRYHTVRRQIEINDPNKAQHFNISLKQAYGWLQISGSGDEKLSIDGRPTTFVPNKKIELMSGHYKVLLEKPLHQPYERSIEIQDSVVCKIEPRFVVNYRELEFKVYNEAEIWIDDVRVATGSWKGKLEYGPHRIECKKESHRTTEMVINVDPQTLGPIVLESPEPIYGTLIVNSTPVGAEIFVDDKFLGSTPGTFRVLVGERKVAIKRTGYNTENKTLTVTESETSRIDVKLNDIIPITISSIPRATLYIDGERVGQTPWSRTVIAGEHKVKLQAPKFYDLEKTIPVDEPYKNFTFKLKRRYYYDSAFVFGLTTMTGFKDFALGGYMGGFIKNFYIEGNFYGGLLPSEIIYWNDLQTDNEPAKYYYKPLMFGGKFGYGFILGSRFRLTPHVGLEGIRAKGTLMGYNETSFDPSVCSALSINGGVKWSCALASCVELTVTPEYYYPIYRTDIYKALYNSSPRFKTWCEGFKLSVGIGLFF